MSSRFRQFKSQDVTGGQVGASMFEACAERCVGEEFVYCAADWAMDVLVYPSSFREVLRHAGLEPAAVAKRWTKGERSVVDKALRAYLTGGGFPDAQGIDARGRFELLRGYVDSALFRDVVERHSVTHPAALRWLVRHLLSNAGGTFSIAKFYSELRSQGIPVAKDTLHPRKRTRAR